MLYAAGRSTIGTYTYRYHRDSISGHNPTSFEK